MPDLLDLDGACAVVATVGTTSTTSVDPRRRDRRRCGEAGVWLHVDAAYAGSAWVCPEFRWSLDGVERADSLVVNPHKWLLTPMDCSCSGRAGPRSSARRSASSPSTCAPTTRSSSLSDYGPARPAASAR